MDRAYLSRPISPGHECFGCCGRDECAGTGNSVPVIAITPVGVPWLQEQVATTFSTQDLNDKGM